MTDWNLAIAEDSRKYGAGYTKTEFTFNKPEHLQLTEQQTIQALAQNATQNIINYLVLPRVGVTPTPENRITFDLTIGRFVVWTPKKASVQRNSKSKS